MSLFAASGPAEDSGEESIGRPCQLNAADETWFEIYRAERVKLTSILFSGEDWRWRFCSSAGLIIASGTGFRTQGECIAAVDALRTGAGSARVRNISAT